MMIRLGKGKRWTAAAALLALLVCMISAGAGPVAADTQYGGSGCMVLYTYFDGQTGSMMFSYPYSKTPWAQVEFKSETYRFDPISQGGNKYSFRAVTLPSKWTGGSLKIYTATPDGYDIASCTTEIAHSVMLRHWAVSASEISTYFEIAIPLVKKNNRINIASDSLKMFMTPVLSVKNGKLTVTIFHNRFPLKKGMDYSLSFGPKKSNGYKDVIMTGKFHYTGKRVIGQVKSSVVFADQKTGNTGNTGTKAKSYKVGDTFTKNNCTYKILTLSGKKGTVRLVKVSNVKGVQEFSNTVTINGYTFTLTEIGPDAFKASSALKSVKLNSSLKKIGDRAFMGCKNLKSVTLDAQLTTIGQKAFANCTSLKSIVIPSKVKTLSAQAFAGCKNLTKVTFKSGKISAVGKQAFANASANIKFVFPKGFPSGTASFIKKTV